MNRYIDLHTHSTASDGTLSPANLIKKAININLSYIALTDHDTMSGAIEAYEAAKNSSLNMIPGVEMSAAYKSKANKNGEIHILGYLLHFNGSHKIINEISKELDIFAKDRENRNLEILKRLNADNYNINYEELKLGNKDTKITRAHFATVLMNKGYVKDRKMAFDTILANNSKYVPAKTTTIERACDFFNKYDLFFALAHPFLYQLDDIELENLILELKAYGMKGIEVYHSTHSQSQINTLKKLANKFNLAATGGSDYHGDTKPNLELAIGYGNLKIPSELIENIINNY